MCCAQLLSHVRLFATPWTIQSMEFSRPEYWSAQPFPSPGDLGGIEPRSPSLQEDSLSAEPQGKPKFSDKGLFFVTTGLFSISVSLLLFFYYIHQFVGFPGGSAGRESACNVGDLGLIPGLRRCPGEGKGYALQYSGLENSMDCIVHGVAKSWIQLSDFHSITFLRINLSKCLH